jgi:hypothetical protein
MEPVRDYEMKAFFTYVIGVLERSQGVMVVTGIFPLSPRCAGRSPSQSPSRTKSQNRV